MLCKGKKMLVIRFVTDHKIEFFENNLRMLRFWKKPVRRFWLKIEAPETYKYSKSKYNI